MHPLLRIALLALAMTTPALADQAPDDPYLWLEPFEGPQITQWVQAENAKTLAVLEKDPHYEGFYRDALTIAEAHDRIPAPTVIAGAVFNFWQDADHVRGIWRRTSVADYATAEPHWKTVLDIDALARAEHANWVWKGFDCEAGAQKRCMVMLSDGGEDATTAREFDLVTGHFVPGGFVLPKGKQRLAWEDADTLLVAREFAPGDLTRSGYPYIVKRWKRGEPLAHAREVFRGTGDDGGYGVNVSALRDGGGHRAVVIARPIGTFEFEHYLVTPKGVARLALPLKAQVDALVSGQLIATIKQDWDAAAITQGTIVALDLYAALRDPAHLAPTVVLAPGPREAVVSVAATRDTLLIDALDNVRGRLMVCRRQATGAWSRATLPLPENSSIAVADANEHGNEAFVSVSGFLQPPTLVAIDALHGSASTIKSLAPKFDASQGVIDQFEAASSDGVKIPYFVVHRLGMPLDGNNPTVINAYGGFDVAVTPGYKAIVGKLWLEHGGVFVLANIRGGGEFGPAWHEAGLKTRRQIIYDDFTAVARDLIARQVTSPRRLGILGGSNGGLLMGVAMTQHPELFNAIDIAVPLLDMLRYEQIAAGTSWVGEYGSVANPDERAFLAAISPYARLERGVKYPEPLIWTTTKDDRVGPQHARKFAARLAEFGAPYYYYEIVEGGHGAGANLRETARTNALEWTYFARKLAGE